MAPLTQHHHKSSAMCRSTEEKEEGGGSQLHLTMGLGLGACVTHLSDNMSAQR